MPMDAADKVLRRAYRCVWINGHRDAPVRRAVWPAIAAPATRGIATQDETSSGQPSILTYRLGAPRDNGA